MKKTDVSKFIKTGGILTIIAVICQSAPVFFSSIGLALSPLSTLPIAIATFYNFLLGSFVFFASSLFLTLISVQEALIFLLTTGLLGIIIGILPFKQKLLTSILFSSTILFIGMTYMTYVLNISAFGDLTTSLPIPLTLLIFLLFSFFYTSFWNISFKKLINFLLK